MGAGIGAGDLLALGIWAVQNGANLVKGHALEVATLATGGEHVPTRRDKSIEPALDRIAHSTLPALLSDRECTGSGLLAHQPPE